jgi:hypothetical protein
MAATDRRQHERPYALPGVPEGTSEEAQEDANSREQVKKAA